jgi:hypothetical protein
VVSAALLQGVPVDRSVLVAVPVVKQLLLQAEQLRSKFSTGAGAFSDGGEVADQVRPAQLALLNGQVVVGREAIAHHNPAKGAPQQLDGGGCGSAQALEEHRHCGGDHDPLPAPFSTGIVPIGVAGGGAGFIHVGHRLLTGSLQRLSHRFRQHGAQTLADLCNRSTADLHPQQLIEQRLGLAETQRKDAAQQTHQGTEPGAVGTGLHISRQRCAGAGGAAGADQAMQPMLDHQRRDRRDLHHLMAQRIWILSRQQRAATAAGIRVVFHHLINPLKRQQLWPRPGMAQLATALAATALASLRRLVARRASAQR